jgi:hypothetical protein
MKSNMALITRRQFVQQTAFSAGALYGLPFKVATATKALEQSGEKPAAIDPAAIRKLASKITGHVITADASDYESARQVTFRNLTQLGGSPGIHRLKRQGHSSEGIFATTTRSRSLGH